MTTETKHTPTPWRNYTNNVCAGPLKGCFIDARKNNESTARIADVLAYGGVASQEECEANAAFIVRACNAHNDLVAVLAELYALVKGECPSLLNEDSGGDAELSFRIEKLLAEEGAG